MTKLISSINMTLDGFCDHNSMIADDDLHENVNELFRTADLLLFGRKTYQLMEVAWPAIVRNPTGNKPTDDFAVLIDSIPKLVVSTTLDKVEWKNARLLKGNLRDEVTKLKTDQAQSRNIVVGGRSVIIQLMNFGLIDECRFCVHPVVLGKGVALFQDIDKRIDLRLLKTKTYASGAVMFYFQPRQPTNNNI